MSQAMNGNSASEVQFDHDATKGSLDGRFIHRLPSVTDNDTLLIRFRKQQLRVPMSFPVISQRLQRRVRQRNKAVLRAFAATYMNSHAFGINVASLQSQRFVESQPTRIDGPEIRVKPRQPNGVHDPANFQIGEHFGKLLFSRNAELIEHLPVAHSRVAKEEPEPPDRNSECPRRRPFFGSQPKQIVFDLLFAKLFWIRIVVVILQLANSS